LIEEQITSAEIPFSPIFHYLIMTSSPAFLHLASNAIEEVMTTFFPDTALYRRLCWGGFDACDSYVHHEFSPEPRLTHDCLSSWPSSNAAAKQLPANGEVQRSGAPRQIRPPAKRRRMSIVEELTEGLRLMETAPLQASSFADGGGTTTALLPDHPGQTALYSVESATPCTPVLQHAPFAVSCVGCATRVISVYPCRVIKGYVVLWAESVLDVRCVPKRLKHPATQDAMTVSPATGAIAHTRVKKISKPVTRLEAPSDRVVFPPPLSGLRVDQQPFKRSLAVALNPRASSSTGTPSAAGRAERQNASRSTPTEPNQTHLSASDCSRQRVVLHSLHIVNDDAVSHVRPGSFVLQSVLQPGMPTALECYPRHMIHFGLLCFAAWHASEELWRNIVEDSGEAKTDDEARETLHAVRALLPRTPEDAVLVLGLGGNVLGHCLDEVLPSAVPLHVVEVEPAVLQACEEHGQFPPRSLASTGDPRSTARSNSSCSTHRVKVTSRAAKGKSTMRGVGASTASSDLWQEAAGRVHAQDGPPVVFFSLRQHDNSPSALDTLSCSVEEKVGRTVIELADGVMPSRAAARQRRPRGNRASRSSQVAAPLTTETRGEYLCFLEDAYAFLRSTPCNHAAVDSLKDTSSSSLSSRSLHRHHSKTARTPSAAPHSSLSSSSETAQPQVGEAVRWDTSAARFSVPLATAVHPVQYRMIFLDCYDPDRERMMHEGGLVELCLRRLQPGAVLLVNAHVLPTVANLRRDFLSHGFATVQVLRVSGSVQTILVCIAPDTPPGYGIRNGPVKGKSEKCDRFTVHQLRKLAQWLNCNESRPSSTSREATEGASSLLRSAAPLRSGFQLDASWLKECRRMTIPAAATELAGEMRSGCVSRSDGRRSAVGVDVRVWQHFF
jgi:hypothetical protein